MIDMLDFIDDTFATHDVVCTNYSLGDYDENGDWADAEPETFEATVNLQPIDRNAVNYLTANGGAVDIQNTYEMHLNNGQQVYHERQKLSGVIQASIVRAEYQGEMRDFRVIYADNREHHNFCQAFIEMLKDNMK